MSQPLASALISRSEFTQQEWEGFCVGTLTNSMFVKSGGTYFAPVPKPKYLNSTAVTLSEVFKCITCVLTIGASEKSARAAALRATTRRDLMQQMPEA